MKDRVKEALDIVRRAKALGDYDSNVIGMAAEVIAEEKYGMIKAPVGTRKIDGYLARGRKTIQVKGWSCSRLSKNKSPPFFRIPWDIRKRSDVLLVILIYSRSAEYDVLYRGAPIGIVKKGKLRGKTVGEVFLSNLKTQKQIKRILKKCQKKC